MGGIVTKDCPQCVPGCRCSWDGAQDTGKTACSYCNQSTCLWLLNAAGFGDDCPFANGPHWLAHAVDSQGVLIDCGWNDVSNSTPRSCLPVRVFTLRLEFPPFAQNPNPWFVLRACTTHAYGAPNGTGACTGQVYAYTLGLDQWKCTGPNVLTFNPALSTGTGPHPQTLTLAAYYGAKAFATIGAGAVTGVTLTNGGSGYTFTPSVTFTAGGGTGAAGLAQLAGGVLTGVTITQGGSGYTSPPVVSFSGPANLCLTCDGAALCPLCGCVPRIWWCETPDGVVHVFSPVYNLTVGNLTPFNYCQYADKAHDILGNSVYTLQETDTPAVDGSIAACSGLGLAQTTVNRQATNNGIPGTGAALVSLNGGALDKAAIFFESAAGEPNLTTWPAGDWKVRLNVKTPGTIDLVWNTLHICRVDANGVVQATVGSVTALAIDLTKAGVAAATVSGLQQNAAATDRIYIVLGLHTVGGDSCVISPDQLIDTPFTVFQADNYGDHLTFNLNRQENDKVWELYMQGKRVGEVTEAQFNCCGPNVFGGITLYPAGNPGACATGVDGAGNPLYCPGQGLLSTLHYTINNNGNITSGTLNYDGLCYSNVPVDSSLAAVPGGLPVFGWDGTSLKYTFQNPGGVGGKWFWGFNPAGNNPYGITPISLTPTTNCNPLQLTAQIGNLSFTITP